MIALNSLFDELLYLCVTLCDTVQHYVQEIDVC